MTLYTWFMSWDDLAEGMFSSPRVLDGWESSINPYDNHPCLVRKDPSNPHSIAQYIASKNYSEYWWMERKLQNYKFHHPTLRGKSVKVEFTIAQHTHPFVAYIAFVLQHEENKVGRQGNWYVPLFQRYPWVGVYKDMEIWNIDLAGTQSPMRWKVKEIRRPLITIKHGNKTAKIDFYGRLQDSTRVTFFPFNPLLARTLWAINRLACLLWEDNEPTLTGSQFYDYQISFDTKSK